jgi:hypothetical protein
MQLSEFRGGQLRGVIEAVGGWAGNRIIHDAIWISSEIFSPFHVGSYLDDTHPIFIFLSPNVHSSRKMKKKTINLKSHLNELILILTWEDTGTIQVTTTSNFMLVLHIYPCACNNKERAGLLAFEIYWLLYAAAGTVVAELLGWCAGSTAVYRWAGPGRDIRIDGNLCQRWALSLAIKRLIDSQLGIGRRRKKITLYRLGCTLCMWWGGGIAARSEFRCSNRPCLIVRSRRPASLLHYCTDVLLGWASGWWWWCRPIDYSINNMAICCGVIMGWAQVQHSTRNSMRESVVNKRRRCASLTRGYVCVAMGQ